VLGGRRAPAHASTGTVCHSIAARIVLVVATFVLVLAAHAVKTSMEMILYVHLVGDVGQMSALQVQMPATVLSRWGIARQLTPTFLASKDRRQFC